jgi:serine/threonine protein kinase
MAYKLVKTLNRGGMADMWLGVSEGPDGFMNPWAIKLVRSDYAHRQDFEQMFAVEAKMLSKMHHPNILGIHEYVPLEGLPAIVMDLNIGADLGQLYRNLFESNSFLPVPMLLYVGAEIAKALHYAHTYRDPVTREPSPIIHRDVSCGNILVSVEGLVRLADFGIAKARDRGFETAVGQIKGKYSYMSPEQLQNKTLDGRSDIFSLGIVLWEGLAGKFRFHGLSDADIHSVLAQPPQFPDLKSLNPTVTDGLQDIIRKALQENPEHRFTSALELSRALEKILVLEYGDFSPEKLGYFVEKSQRGSVQELRDQISKALTSRPAMRHQIADPPASHSSAGNSSHAVATPYPGQTSEKINVHVGGDSVPAGVHASRDAQGELRITVNLDQPGKTPDLPMHKGRDLTLVDQPVQIKKKTEVSSSASAPIKLQHQTSSRPSGVRPSVSRMPRNIVGRKSGLGLLPTLLIVLTSGLGLLYFLKKSGFVSFKF